MTLPLGTLIDTLGGTLVGDPAQLITGLAPIDTATAGQLSFVSNVRYRPLLTLSQALCVVVGEDLRDAASARGACIVAADPYLYFARVTQLWRRRHAVGGQTGIHPTAVIDPLAVVAADAVVGPLCVVERGATIGGAAVVLGHLSLADHVHISAASVVTRSIHKAGHYTGIFPIDDNAQWEKNAAAVKRLHSLRARLVALENLAPPTPTP